MGGAGELGSRCVSCHRFCGAAKVVWPLFSSVPKLKNKIHDAAERVRAPPLVVVAGHGDWCRCRFGLGKIPDAGVKKRRQGGHYNHFGCMQVGWRWNAFMFLSAEKIVPS